MFLLVVQPEDQLVPVFAESGADVVVCGHTHMQFDRRIGGARVLNAGSVGMPFGMPGACWLLLGSEIEFRRTDYDLARAAARIRTTYIPRRKNSPRVMSCILPRKGKCWQFLQCPSQELRLPAARPLTCSYLAVHSRNLGVHTALDCVLPWCKANLPMANKHIEQAKSSFSLISTSWLAHSARQAVASGVSLVVARLFKMPEAYWAPVTTLIVMQSTLGAAWTSSKFRLIGTALGAALGALLAGYFSPGFIVFGLAIFVLGLLCAILRLDQSAYRFAGITLTIVMLVARPQPHWMTGLHRFIEVSLGIGVALILTAIWPQRALPVE